MQNTKKEKMTSLQKIREMVEFETGLDISVPTRKREYVCARNIYYKLAKNHTTATTTAIGRTLGKDHGTILHGIKAFDNYYYDKHYYANEIELYTKLDDELSEYTEQRKRLVELMEEDFDLAKKYNELGIRYNYLLARLKLYEPERAEEYRMDKEYKL